MTLRDDLERMEREDKAATPEEYELDPSVTGPAFADEMARTAEHVCSIMCDSEEDQEETVRHTTTCRVVREAFRRASFRTDRPALVEMVRLLLDKLFWESMDVGGAIDQDSSLIQEMWVEAKKKASKR